MLSRFYYIAVILIWSTTPLAIKYTAQSFGALESLFFRMSIAAALGCFLVAVFSGKTLQIRKNYKLYAVASFSIFPNMLIVYYASTFISSGMVALLFGLSPFFTMLLSKPVLGTNSFSVRQVVAGLIALFGLVIILYAPLSGQDQLSVGVPLMMLSNACFAWSGLQVKKITRVIHANTLQQCVGATVFSLPGLALCYFGLNSSYNYSGDGFGMVALAYLVIVASLLGFVAYYHVIKNMTVNSLAVIPFITPALALIFGMLLAGEQFPLQVFFGAGFILLGLAIYQNLMQPLLRCLSLYKVGLKHR